MVFRASLLIQTPCLIPAHVVMLIAMPPRNHETPLPNSLINRRLSFIQHQIVSQPCSHCALLTRPQASNNRETQFFAAFFPCFLLCNLISIWTKPFLDILPVGVGLSLIFVLQTGQHFFELLEAFRAPWRHSEQKRWPGGGLLVSVTKRGDRVDGRGEGERKG